MRLSPDGRWLYYLYRKEPGDLRLARIDTQSWERSADVKVWAKAEALALASDGKFLYVPGEQPAVVEPDATQKQVIYQVATATWKVTKTLEIELPPFDIAVTKTGMLFVSVYVKENVAVGPKAASVLIVDVEHGKTIARWESCPWRGSVQLSPDERRLYMANTRPPGPTEYRSWDLPETLADKRPPERAFASNLNSITVRGGEWFATPDGEFLLDRSGKVLKLAN
jgi:hypothetical protein